MRQEDGKGDYFEYLELGISTQWGRLHQNVIFYPKLCHVSSVMIILTSSENMTMTRPMKVTLAKLSLAGWKF